MTEAINTSNDAPAGVNANYDTRLAGFSLNHTKQIRNMKRDASIANFDTVINNHDENINIKCSSGFFLEVANPAMLDLAKQTYDNHQLKFGDVFVKCSNTRLSLDNHNLLVNNTLFFDLCNITSGNTIGTVTAHCHITTKVIQLQGSKIVDGCKAPIWLFNNILKGTFEREEKAKSETIQQTNKNIENLGSELECKSCDKKYRTANGLQKHIAAKHANLES